MRAAVPVIRSVPTTAWPARHGAFQRLAERGGGEEATCTHARPPLDRHGPQQRDQRNDGDDRCRRWVRS